MRHSWVYGASALVHLMVHLANILGVQNSKTFLLIIWSIDTELINMFIMILILKYADLYLILFVILLLEMLLPIKILVMMMLVMLVLVILIMVMPMLVMPTFQLVAAGFCAASLSLLILLSMPHLSQMPVT